MIEQEGPLSLGQTLFYIEQVASALDQAHEQGLIHRDVKPANVLIARPSDRAYLTDFGIVKQMSTHGLTKPSYFLGTYEYSAPEQIEGKQVDRRTDLYALGCIVYECLSAEPPFKGDTEGALIRQHLTEPAPRLATMRPDLPVAVTDVVAIAMAKQKEDRYPTCGDFIRALRAVALGTTTGASYVPARETVYAGVAGISPAEEDGGDGGDPPGLQPPPGASPPPSAPPPEPSGKSGPRTVTVTGRRIAALALAFAIPVVAAILAIFVFRDDEPATRRRRDDDHAGDDVERRGDRTRRHRPARRLQELQAGAHPARGRGDGQLLVEAAHVLSRPRAVLLQEHVLVAGGL